MDIRRAPSVERLETRTFLSVVPATALTSAPPGGAVVTPIIPVVNGPALHATAGTPFHGVVGFYASPVLDPPLVYRATINWGDGTASTAATLTYGKHGAQFGYVIRGTHIFAKAATYSVKVTLFTAPINPQMGLPDRLIETIVDKAIVSPFPKNSAGGVTIHEVPGKAFAAVVGTFSFPAPNTSWIAQINWGDGSTSKGVVTATGVSGIDVINFKVTGGHTYALAGKYAITVSIGRPLSALPFAITIDSTAIVAAPVAV